MATSFFGGSFFAGEFFNSATPTPPTAPTVTPAGGVVRKRWWRLGKRVYFGTEDQAEQLYYAALAKKPEEKPKLKSKPAPKRAEPKPETVEAIELPDLPVFEYDWRPLYQQAALYQDYQAARAIEAAIRRMLDEDDEDVILLLH